MKINIAILGYGYWGPNLVRNFTKFKNCNILYIVDKNEHKLKKAQKLYPNIKCISNPLEAIKDNNVNAVIIALPVNQHYKYAKFALENNKHLLIEKPATDSKEKLQKLVNIAKKKKLTFMVDYTFLYTPAVKKIKKFIDDKFIGNILFVEAQRLNLGIFRNDVNVIWDLAVHDVSVIQYLLNKMPKYVSARGVSYLNSKTIDLSYIMLEYGKKQIGHVSSSWLFPFKNKKLIIAGSKKTIIYDDVEPINKIKIYDKGYDVSSSIEYKIDNFKNVYIPKLSKEEALYNLCKEFLSSIIDKKNPLTNGQFALQISSILGACDKYIKNNKKQKIS